MDIFIIHLHIMCLYCTVVLSFKAEYLLVTSKTPGNVVCFVVVVVVFAFLAYCETKQRY